MKDYYEILGLIPSAETAAIKGAYHGLANNYHPDKFKGNPDEAHAKMAELNEAWDVLSDPTKKLNYDQQRENPVASSNSRLSFKELDADTNPIKDVQEISLNQFPSGVALLEIKLSKEDAIARFMNEFNQIIDKLPKNTDTELIINNTRIALFPYWRFAGSVDSDFKATGIIIDKKQVKCGKCNGSGSTGRGGSKSRCQRCSGSGKDIHRTTKKSVENGSTTVNVNDALLNYTPTIQFNLAKSLLHTTEPILVPESRRSSWKCVSPDSTDLKDGKSRVLDILSEKLFDDIRSSLSVVYDAVEGIQLNPTNNSVITIPLLCPAYVTWFEIKSKTYYAVCDAVTGSVSIQYKFPNKFWKFFKKLLLIMLVLFVVIILIGILVPSSKPNANPADITDTLPVNIPTHPISENNNTASANSGEVVIQAKFKPSFDCNKATAKLEKWICSDEELSNLDNALASSFGQAKLRTSDIGVLKQNSINALQLRNRCEDKECLKNWYLERISSLDNESTQNLSNSLPNNENESTKNNQAPPIQSCSPAESAMHANGC